MLGGTLMHLSLTLWGYLEVGEFRAYEFAGMLPFIWDLIASAILAVVFSLIDVRPDQQLVRKFFYK